MPSLPFAQNARSLIVRLRWLCALFRQRLGRFPFPLKSFILWLRIGAQRIGHALFNLSPTRDDVNVENNTRLRLLSYPDDQPMNEDIRIRPSRQPITRNSDETVINEDREPSKEIESVGDVAVSNDPQSAQSCPTMPAPPDSSEGSATLNISAMPNLQPIFPENSGRYYREIIRREQTQGEIPPQTYSFAPNEPPPGWISRLHPEGARYFVHPERRIFTDLDLCDEKKFLELNDVVGQVVESIRVSGGDRDPHYAALLGGVPCAPSPDLLVDLVIDSVVGESGEVSWRYYFINHSQRCPFSLHTRLTSELLHWQAIQGSIEKEQLRHAMECQYWQHCAMFPDSLQLAAELINELQDYLIYSTGDISTSAMSTVSAPIEDLKTWLSLVRQLPCHGLGSACTFARLMAQLAQDRFLNFHGMPCARLSLDQSVYDENKPTRSFLFRAVSPLLFFATEVYLQYLENAYTDKMALTRVWTPLIQKLNKEWEDFILLATFILNANVGFLAIQSVDNLPPSGHHSTVQILSYLSIVVSIGSIMLGLLLVRQNRTKFHEAAWQISQSIDRRTSEKFGVELLALIFALPWALLMWSMIFFFGAFMVACMRVPGTVARSIIGVAAVIMVLLVLWCIWDAWDMQAAHKPPFGSAFEVEDSKTIFKK
ncbi:hypothetical protein MVEN_00369100 [Mycena venus]|uniref:Uncharacterized protein n=1 Tax=Mycena venus TaxID=2733690 RepID=A0A8H6YTN2_9AGAR|nr:hypothetical protein MVEN_00369100 [Mycena venus]